MFCTLLDIPHLPIVWIIPVEIFADPAASRTSMGQETWRESPIAYETQKDASTTCKRCNKSFANVGCLTKHTLNNVCKKGVVDEIKFKEKELESIKKEYQLKEEEIKDLKNKLATEFGK